MRGGAEGWGQGAMRQAGGAGRRGGCRGLKPGRDGRLDCGQMAGHRMHGAGGRGGRSGGRAPFLVRACMPLRYRTGTRSNCACTSKTPTGHGLPALLAGVEAVRLRTELLRAHRDAYTAELQVGSVAGGEWAHLAVCSGCGA